MKRFIAGLAVLAIIMYSCTKDVPSHGTYQAGIAFTNVSSPDSVLLGDTIKINVHCSAKMVAGTVDFLGFQLIENPIHYFGVTAIASYDIDGVSSPQNFDFDKTLGVPTTAKGMHVFNFYNAQGDSQTIFQTDTVIVK